MKIIGLFDVKPYNPFCEQFVTIKLEQKNPLIDCPKK